MRSCMRRRRAEETRTDRSRRATPLVDAHHVLHRGLMSKNPDDIKQPLDHLPPREERDKAIEVEEPIYPTSETPTGPVHASPETAAEPGKPKRHGVDKLPPS